VPACQVHKLPERNLPGQLVPNVVATYADLPCFLDCKADESLRPQTLGPGTTAQAGEEESQISDS
jgi:hypothetical protein